MLLRIVLTLLSFTCVSSLYAEGLHTVKDKLAHRYSIYFASPYESESDLCSRYGSHFHFVQSDTLSIPTYIYYIAEDRVKTGRVLSYEQKDRVRVYLLENFFEGGYNAKMLISDIEDNSNLKLAYIYFANEEEDKTGICQQYLLIDDEAVGFK